MKRLLITNTLFLLLSGIACSVYADDVYNFYFQKNPPPGTPGTANVVVPSTAAPAPLATAPVTSANLPATSAAAPVTASASASAPTAQVAADAPPPATEAETPFRHWNIGVGMEKFTSYSDWGPNISSSSNNAVSLNLGYDFSKNWGIWTQVYFSGTMLSGGVDYNGYALPPTPGPIGSQIDASAALTYTPLIVPLFGSHSLKLSLLVGAITSSGVAMTATPSSLGTFAQPMWGAVASYNFSDKVSFMVDTKDYEQALPNLNYVSDQIGFNLEIKL